MRRLSELDHYRDVEGEVRHYGGRGDDVCGAFVLASPFDHGRTLRVIASIGSGWEHVSVSTASRCPIWDEMEYVKRKFFDDHETVMQLHVPVSDHINRHPYCLHLWKPVFLPIPLPSKLMV